MVETVPVRITRGCLAALPSDLHRIFARKLIASGEWELVDDDRGWFEEAAGRVWIRSTRIATFVEKLKRPSLTARTLSRICRDAGALTGPSESRRNIGNATGTRRVWPFDRAFAWSGTTAVPAPVSIPILLESMARPGVQ